MKIGIYDPYLHILGGAERYILTIALILGKNNEIILFGENKSIIKIAHRKFGFKMPEITMFPWSDKRNERNRKLKQLDLFLYVTDGSIFWSPAKFNILLIQSPLHIPKNNILNNIKLIKWQKILCYSKFMAEIIQKRLHKSAETLFVPVEKINIINQVKQNQIVSVGRFFPHIHNKKQLEMVNIFREMVENGTKNTKLILVGSIDPGGENYFAEVKRAAYGLPIEIITNAPYKQLFQIYSSASIYWHAAGYDEDLTLNPEKAEHFGVSTVEAMMHGCVPIVFAGGGQLEIVQHEINGFLWKEIHELIEYTEFLLTNENYWQEISKQAIKAAHYYTLDKFSEKLKEIIKIE
ncbi:MAG: Glycosyl transferase family 2 [Candidatus Gottesmanbacteria bacterium GW2011_GWA1_34_13]|uniref:Glycosyl transferase family 2 n=1 Tax=Candidatus Gottesmanbacteria bacterium GW2011_GWA1_34_13 TaxID=1618434 RepID=A0A0G0ASZ0_9BACT|nr:MAG: Glycosyl transferase family 2 [Candidatus Gottesmanbacteria bacterium GW2011_GWA1_34_13]